MGWLWQVFTGWLAGCKTFLVRRGEEKLASPAGILVGRGWPGWEDFLVFLGLNPELASFRNKGERLTLAFSLTVLFCLKPSLTLLSCAQELGLSLHRWRRLDDGSRVILRA